VAALPLRQGITADTVVMNPPFGTRTRGADVAFLRAAFAVSCAACES
jgi:rRNA N6-adenosine-methyltransferase METTL5